MTAVPFLLAFYRSDRAHFLAAARAFRAAGNIEAARDEADEMAALRRRFAAFRNAA